MNTITGLATHIPNLGQVDSLYQPLSLESKDFFRFLIDKLGGVNQSPISVIAAVEGMYTALSSFAGNSTEQFHLLNSVAFLKEEFSRVNLDSLIPHFRLSRKRAKWIKWQLFEFIHLLENFQSNYEVKFVAIYLFCLLKGVEHNRRIPSILFKYLEHGHKSLNEKDSRALLKMERNVKLYLVKGEEVFTESFIEKVNSHFQNKIHYADTKTRQSVFNRDTYSPEEFKVLCQQLRGMADDPGLSKAVCLTFMAMMTNLPISYIHEIPIFESASDDWVIALSILQGVLYLDLSIIAPNAAHPVGEGYLPASQILIKPLPSFLVVAIQEYLSEASRDIKTIGDVLGDDAKLPAIKHSKLANTYAKYASEKVDLFLGGLLANDFRIFPKSRLYYLQITRLEVWSASQHVFDSLGFGGPTAMIAGLNIGSSAVLSDEAVSRLFQDLAESVAKTRPSNNAAIEKVITFHEKYTYYIATLTIFCLALRDANPIALYSNQVLYQQRFVILNDKNVHANASPQPVTICQTLYDQFVLYRAHCQTLLNKLNRNEEPRFNKFKHSLESLLAGNAVPLLITPTSLKGLSSKEVSSSWLVKAPHNFGRHYWASNFRGLGITDREISAHLRHQEKGNLNWSTESNLVLSALTNRVDLAQTERLLQLGIYAIPGLSRRAP